MITNTETIFLGTNYRVNWICDVAKPSQVIFAFTNWTSKEIRALETQAIGTGYGTSTARHHNVGVIEIIPRRNCWYQSFWTDCQDSILTFMHARKIGHMPRLAYGSNMGAYGALAHIKQLSLNRILALSPQYEIDKDYDQRWKRYAPAPLKKRIIAQFLKEITHVTIVVDPYNPDYLHAVKLDKLLSKDATVKVTQAPYSSHPVCSALQQAGILPVYVKLFIEDKLNQENGPLIARRSHPYLLSKALKLAYKHQYARAACYMSLRDPFVSGLSKKQKHFHFLAKARFLKHSGKPTAALESILLARKISPNDSKTKSEEKYIRLMLKTKR